MHHAPAGFASHAPLLASLATSCAADPVLSLQHAAAEAPLAAEERPLAAEERPLAAEERPLVAAADAAFKTTDAALKTAVARTLLLLLDELLVCQPLLECSRSLLISCGSHSTSLLLALFSSEDFFQTLITFFCNNIFISSLH